MSYQITHRHDRTHTILSYPAANLREADLAGRDLTRADLAGANLGGANLAGACLHQADLQGAFLTDADLRKAVLTKADLRGANLLGSDLTGADFSGAKVADAIFPAPPGTTMPLTIAEAARATAAWLRENLWHKDRWLETPNGMWEPGCVACLHAAALIACGPLGPALTHALDAAGMSSQWNDTRGRTLAEVMDGLEELACAVDQNSRQADLRAALAHLKRQHTP